MQMPMSEVSCATGKWGEWNGRGGHTFWFGLGEGSECASVRGRDGLKVSDRGSFQSDFILCGCGDVTSTDMLCKFLNCY